MQIINANFQVLVFYCPSPYRIVLKSLLYIFCCTYIGFVYVIVSWSYKTLYLIVLPKNISKPSIPTPVYKCVMSPYNWQFVQYCCIHRYIPVISIIKVKFSEICPTKVSMLRKVSRQLKEGGSCSISKNNKTHLCVNKPIILIIDSCCSYYLYYLISVVFCFNFVFVWLTCSFEPFTSS